MSLITIHETGSLFNSGCQALVDPVNCMGVHGKGLALEFKKRWPGAVELFSKECRLGEVEPGNVWNQYVGVNPKWLLFFPTKIHWRDASKLEYIESGLEDLISDIQELEITSVALPALGCGLGGLDWRIVKPVMEEAARRMLVKVDIYAPQEKT